MLPDEGYLVAQTIRSGMKQSIALLLPVDQSDPDKEDLEAIPAKDVKTVAKSRSSKDMRRCMLNAHRECGTS